MESIRSLIPLKAEKRIASNWYHVNIMQLIWCSLTTSGLLPFQRPRENVIVRKKRKCKALVIGSTPVSAHNRKKSWTEWEKNRKSLLRLLVLIHFMSNNENLLLGIKWNERKYIFLSQWLLMSSTFLPITDSLWV